MKGIFPMFDCLKTWHFIFLILHGVECFNNIHLLLLGETFKYILKPSVRMALRRSVYNTSLCALDLRSL